MKIIVDDKIPYIKGQIERLADEVVYKAGTAITCEDAQDADAMIIRTRTHCNRALLEGTRVGFIATATIGYDHIDTKEMVDMGIQWTNCPGCNATSVAQYVRNCLLAWQEDKGKDLGTCTLGIVGVGHVGKEVLQACHPLVKEVLLCDPPRAKQEGSDGFHSLQELAERCDIITLHTPLTTSGNYPTLHLVDEAWLKSLKCRPLLINSGRGEVADNVAVERALDEGWIADAIIDTWEREPHLRLSLLNKVYIGTPHIAGYSADGKANATRMSLEAVARWMGKEMTFEVLPPSLPSDILLNANPLKAALQLYDPREDSRRLKSAPGDFELLRGNYPLRREKKD